MGRSRPRLGLALLLAGLIGLVGGQVYALASAPGGLVCDGDPEVQVLVPKEGTGTDEKHIVRVLTFSDLVPGEPVLLEHLSVVLSPGESASASAAGTGHFVPGEFEFMISRTPEGRDRLHIDVQIDQAAGTLSSSTSCGLEDAGTTVHHLRLGTRSTRGRFTALFPRSTFPAAILPTTLIVVDPAPAGVAEAGVSAVLSRATDRWSELINRGVRSPSPDAPRNNSTRGIATLFSSMGIFAWLMLALAGTGSAFLLPRPGLGLGIFLLLAPLLLAGLDRYALSRHEAALGHEDVRVRASAMVGLQESVLFGISGPRRVKGEELEGDERDQEISARIQTMLPRRTWTKVRQLIRRSER